TLNIVRQSNYAACFAALSDGRVDYVFGTSSAAKTAMTNLGIANRLVELPFPIGTATLHAIVAKGHPQASLVMSRLNAAIESLRNSEAYQKRINTYLNVAQ
ncbi:MAG: transporter substrate-binding domain-containing protein, partial [Pseudomonadota bacterium]